MPQDVLSGLKNSSSKDIDELKEVIDKADALKFSPDQLEDARKRLTDLQVDESRKISSLADSEIYRTYLPPAGSGC